MKKNISQRDIAKILNINVSTVSRALKGSAGVSAELRQKIINLAKEYGYRPNPFAMSLRYDTTRTIGVVVPDLAFSHYAQIIKSIEASARKAGYMCIVTDTDDKYDNEVASIELLENLHVEGIAICISQETTKFSHLEQLKENNIPVVLFDRTADADFSSVAINDIATARQATLHLIEDGARHIAFLGGPNRMKQTLDRKHGYLEALREKNIPIRKELVRCNFASYNSGLSDTLDLLDMPIRPDAIVAAHGLLTSAAVQAILSQGFHIPEDIEIVGYISDWISGTYQPRLTFVKQNLKEIGRKTFQLLQKQMEGDESIHHLIVKAHLEVRESTKNKA